MDGARRDARSQERTRMAEEKLTSPVAHDVTAHVEDYARFTTMFKWGALACLAIGLIVVVFVL